MCCPKESKNKFHLGIVIIFAFLAVVFIWWLSWDLIDNRFICSEDKGAFGDQFGAVNALFSGLAFAGLIVTLLYQKEELKLQREELAQTRGELKAQREEFEEQNKTLKRQRFENTFFNMLSLQQEIVANLSYKWTLREKYFNFETQKIDNEIVEKIYNGRSVFEAIYKEVNVETQSGVKCRGGVRNIIESIGIVEYVNIREISRFDHYFRHLYRIYKFVDSSPLIEDSERYDYACIIRSQLSDYELVMLFYNCLSSNGKEKFKPLIERYSVFNNLREGLLVTPDDKAKYKNKAYDRCAEDD